MLENINRLADRLKECADPEDKTFHDSAAAIRALVEVVETKEYMLVCYRLGRRPSEAVLDRARTAQEKLDALNDTLAPKTGGEGEG